MLIAARHVHVRHRQDLAPGNMCNLAQSINCECLDGVWSIWTANICCRRPGNNNNGNKTMPACVRKGYMYKYTYTQTKLLSLPVWHVALLLGPMKKRHLPASRVGIDYIRLLYGHMSSYVIFLQVRICGKNNSIRHFYRGKAIMFTALVINKPKYIKYLNILKWLALISYKMLKMFCSWMKLLITVIINGKIGQISVYNFSRRINLYITFILTNKARLNHNLIYVNMAIVSPRLISSLNVLRLEKPINHINSCRKLSNYDTTSR